MKKSCKYCGRTHKTTEICTQRPARRYSASDISKARKFRNTSAWQKKREEIRERDHYLCRYCADIGRIVYTGVEVHHIEPIESYYDLRLEDDNLICLCERYQCHKKAERGEIEKKILRELAKKEIPPLPMPAPKT